MEADVQTWTSKPDVILTMSFYCNSIYVIIYSFIHYTKMQQKGKKYESVKFIITAFIVINNQGVSATVGV